MIFTTVIILILFICGEGSSAPIERYVSLEGVDISDCGNRTFPCKTLVFSLYSSPDDVELEIILFPGNYSGIDYCDLHVSGPSLLTMRSIDVPPTAAIMDEYGAPVLTSVIIDCLSEWAHIGTVIPLRLLGITFINGSRSNSLDQYTGCVTSSSNVTVFSCVFSNCYSNDDFGGAILVSNSVDTIIAATISNSFVYSCSSADAVVSLIAQSMVNRIENSIFGSNDSHQRGTLTFYGGDVVNCTFFDNYCSVHYSGGAIFAISSDTEITISDSVFMQNVAVTGGALCIQSDKRVLISNSTFRENHGWNSGGAIYIMCDSIGVNVSIIDSSLSWNYAGFGGAVEIEVNRNTSALDWTGTFFANNSAGKQACDILITGDVIPSFQIAGIISNRPSGIQCLDFTQVPFCKGGCSMDECVTSCTGSCEFSINSTNRGVCYASDVNNPCLYGSCYIPSDDSAARTCICKGGFQGPTCASSTSSGECLGSLFDCRSAALLIPSIVAFVLIVVAVISIVIRRRKSRLQYVRLN